MAQRIQQDTISMTLSVLAILASVYLYTFDLGLLNIFPALLLVMGIVMNIYVNRSISYDEAINEGGFKNLVIYSFVAVAGLGAASVAAGLTNSLFIPGSITQLSIADQAVFAIEIAIAEEQFFRGFLTSFFWSRFKSTPIAVIASAAIFAVYHLAVYSTSEASLVYVFVAGAFLSYCAIASKRITVPIIGHVINNILAVLG